MAAVDRARVVVRVGEERLVADARAVPDRAGVARTGIPGRSTPAHSIRRARRAGFLVVCLLASSLVDRVTANDASFVGISQGLVVLGWVAMWQPAQQMVQAISLRLSKRSYRELARLPIDVAWA